MTAEHDKPRDLAAARPDSVTRAAWTDISDLLAPDNRARQNLPGFDDEYVDIVDFIIRVTHRIWEEKNVGLCAQYYSPDAVIHTLSGDVRGAEEVTRQTTRMLAAFPDRSLYGDNVVWSQESDGSFYTSHRITSHLTHQGHGDLGEPTGRRASVLTIADCIVRENRIVEEWLMRDSIGLLLQLGFDPHRVAQQQASRGARDQDFEQWRDGSWQMVQAQPSAAPGDMPMPREAPGEFAAMLLDRLWNHQMFGAVEQFYAYNCSVQGPSGRRLFGHGEIVGHIVSLRAAFPDARLTVEHVCATPGPEDETDIALRWLIAGTNTAPSFYGRPSGRRVLIMGATHWRLTGDRITEEWTVFDELAVLRQIYGS
ncbi:MAG: ester cyclase [Gammaproteobacteria bacterium]|nr:ester cyclase [Gammaproteobacteria bacterium]